MSLSTIAEQSTAILAEYLDLMASMDGVSNEIREQARIGSDVIAASMQADQVAKWSLNGFGNKSHDVRPIGVFAMTRSSIYGLHYLYNIKQVRGKKPTVQIGKFIKSNEKNWNSSLLAEHFGTLDHDHSGRMKKWGKLSEIVHIIPTIREKGGTTISHKVDFSFSKNISNPSKHALLPEYFVEEAKMYLDWRSKIAIGCIIGFRKKYPSFFNERSLTAKVFHKLENEVWPDCNDFIRGISDLLEINLEVPLMDLANNIFSKN